MATISLTLPSDGQTIDASDVNNPFNTIAAEINGNLDNSNIKAGAAIDRSKIAGFTDGWESLNYSPSTVAYNGNRSYDLTFSTVNLTTNISNGMRLKLARSVTPPTQCTSLNGTSQYYSRASASVSGMTFTDDFTVSAWIKLDSYTGAVQNIISRRTTYGWAFRITSGGLLSIVGINSSGPSYRGFNSYQSIPLGKWVHVAASLDMSGNTGNLYIDGILVPSYPDASGSPTTLTQNGDLVIGAYASGTEPFDGKIAQVAVFSSILSASTIRSYISQGLSGSETSLISAYSFNNSINDLNTSTANNLTAQGSAVATNTDSPFNATEYAIVTANSFATNTTLTVQVPEGYSLPTTGGIGTCYFSTQKVPYGFPVEKGKWTLQTFLGGIASISLGSLGTWYISNFNLTVPVGKWILGIQSNLSATSSVSGIREGNFILSSAAELPSLSAALFNDAMICHFYAATGNYWMGRYVGYKDIDISAQTTYSLYGSIQSSTGIESWYVNKTNEITAECAYL